MCIHCIHHDEIVDREADVAGTDLLGEFEQLVLLAILQQQDEAYAILIRSTLEEGTERSVSRGALYRTLDRLEEKGMVGWDLEEPTPDRGGSPRKRFHVRRAGVEALRRSRAVVSRLSAGLEDVLEQVS
jgi:DNA-binding PadR family transcriptional regulator